MSTASPRTLLEELAGQTRRNPALLALKDDAQTWSYAELDRATNRVANALLARRAADHEPVGVLARHGAEAVVALWGVTKAGQIRLPLDSHAPPARLREIVEHAGARVVLTDRAHGDLASELANVETIELERVAADAPDVDPGIEIAPGDLFGLVYTSGSTGRPKAVVVGHSDALAASQTVRDFLRYEPTARVALTAALTVGASRGFDGALIAGASVHTFDLGSRGVAPMVHWLREERITHFTGVTTAVRALLDGLPAAGAGLPDLRTIHSGGEPMSREDVERMRSRVGRRCTLNYGYASTETWHGTLFVAGPETVLEAGPIPVGKALPGIEVWIDDADADGVGQIMMRSRLVAVGYWKEPELTAASFGADPREPEVRTFHTGDLGRLLRDGTLAVVGRRDSRVKIRGYAVDLSEVEAALLALPDVERAAVTLTERGPEDERLVAHYVPAGATPTVNALRRDLLLTLPPYMVPAAFRSVASLPATVSGKVDRRALGSWPSSRPILDEPYEAPRSEVERTLVEIWEGLLRIRPVGIHDDFYALGGDSLKAAEAKIAAGESLGVEVPLMLFAEAAGTVATIARALQLREEAAFQGVVPLQPGGAAPPFFCAGGVGGEILELSALAPLLAPDHPFYGLQVVGNKGDRALRSVPALAQHFLELIHEVAPQGPIAVGGYSSGGAVAFELARRLSDAGRPPEAVVLLDAPAPGLETDAAQDGPRRDRDTGRWRKRFLRVALDLQVLSGRAVPPRWLEVYRTNQGLRAARAYRPRPYPGSLLLLRTDAPASSRGLGWETLARGGVDVIDVPGEHHSMLMPPHVHAVGAALRDFLPPAAGQRAGYVDGKPVVPSQ